MSKISSRIARSTGMTDAFFETSIASGQQQLADAIAKLEERIINETWKLQTGKRGNLLSPKVNLKQAQKIHTDLTSIFDETYGKEARQVTRRYSNAANFIQTRWRELDLAMDFTSVDKDILDTISKTNFNEFRRFGKAAEDAIARAMYDAVAAQTGVEELRKRISEALTGQLSKRGLPMSVYANQFVHDGMMAYAQALTLKKSQDGNFNHFLYVGNLMKTSRAFCIARAGKVYTRKEIESWDFPWAGKAGPALTHRGGYRCRHHWQPVKPEWVEEIEEDDGFQEQINLVSDKTNQVFEQLKLYGVKPNTKQALFVQSLIDNAMTNAQVKALPWNKSQNLFKDVFDRLKSVGLAEVLEDGKRVIRAVPEGFKMPTLTPKLPTPKRGYNEFGYKLGSKADLFIKELQGQPLTNDQIRALSWNKASNLYPDVYRKVKGFGYAGVDEAGRKFMMIPGSTAETPVPAALVSPKKAPVVSQKFYKPKNFDEASNYMDELLTAENQFMKEVSEIDEEWASGIHSKLSGWRVVNPDHYNLTLADIEDAEKAFKMGLAPEAEEVVHRYFGVMKEQKKARAISNTLGPMDSKVVKEQTTSILNQYLVDDIKDEQANRLFEELAERRFVNRPIIFDFKESDPVLSKVIIDSVDELDRKYPGVMERLYYYGTYEGELKRWPKLVIKDFEERLEVLRKSRVAVTRYPWDDNTYAHASQDGRRIGLNPKWFIGEAKLDRSVEWNQAISHFAKGDKLRHGGEYLATHEFGHQVHMWLDEKYNGMGSAISRSFAKLLSKTIGDRNFVSNYATYKAKGFGNNAAELMAEMFANSRHAASVDKAPLTRLYEQLLDFTTKSTTMQRYDMRKALYGASEFMNESNTTSDLVNHIRISVRSDTLRTFEQSMKEAGNVMDREL